LSSYSARPAQAARRRLLLAASRFMNLLPVQVPVLQICPVQGAMRGTFF
jgi:hypothetical protein